MRRQVHHASNFNTGRYKETLNDMFDGISNPQLEQTILKAIQHLYHLLDEAQEKLPVVVDPDEPREPEEHGDVWCAEVEDE